MCVCACSCLCVLSPNHLHILCPDLHIYSILCFVFDRRKSMKFRADLNKYRKNIAANLNKFTVQIYLFQFNFNLF